MEVLVEAAEGSRLPRRVFDAAVVNGPGDRRSEKDYLHESARVFWGQRTAEKGVFVFGCDEAHLARVIARQRICLERQRPL
eukprot:3166888-Lingulodinium_polyedra.AAC.1